MPPGLLQGGLDAFKRWAASNGPNTNDLVVYQVLQKLFPNFEGFSSFIVGDRCAIGNFAIPVAV